MIKNKFLLFLIVGLPSYILGIGLNYYLVEFLKINLYFSYAIILIIQIIINFYLNLKFVFYENNKESKKKFLKFFIVIINFRIIDWIVYYIFVDCLCFLLCFL